MAVSVGEIEATLKLKDELTAQLKKSEDAMKQFGQTSQNVNALISKFGGGDAIRNAVDYADAVARVGGVSKLTASEQLELAKALDAANEKFRVLGQEVPDQLKKVGNELITLNKTDAPGFIDKIRGAFSNLGPSLLATAGGFAGALLSVEAFQAGLRAVIGFVKDSVNAYAESEKAQRKLIAALEAQNTAVPGTVKAFGELAKQFQRTTTFSDDLITEMQTLLVQVGNVMPRDMEAALSAATNLASGLGVDLRTATLLVAKAFEDNFTSLKKYGVQIDESRAKTEGMTYVLGQIQAKFGGQAAADVHTFSGQIEQLGNEFDDLKESIGGVIVESPILKTAFALLRAEIAQTSQEVNALIGYARLLGTLPGPIGAAFRGTVGDLNAYGSAARQAAEAQKQLTANLPEAPPDLLAKLNKQFQAGIADLPALPDKFAPLLENWTQRMKDAQQAIKNLTPAQREQLESAKKLNDEGYQVLAKQLLKNVDAIAIFGEKTKENKKVVDEAAKAYREWANAVTGANLLQSLGDLEVKLAKLEKETTPSAMALKEVAEQALDLGKQIGFLPPKLQSLVNQFFGFEKATIGGALALPKFSDALSLTGDEINDLAKQFQSVNKAIVDFNKITNKPSGLQDLFKGGVSGADINELFSKIDSVHIAAKKALKDAAVEFPDMLAQAIIHGSGITDAIRATLVKAGGAASQLISDQLFKAGSKIGKTLGPAFQATGAIASDFLFNELASGKSKKRGALAGAALGAQIGTAIAPGIGTAIGAGVGAIAGVISGNRNITKKAREEFAQALGFGNQGSLFSDLQKLGAEGQKLANIGLNVIGKHDEAGNKKWMEDVEKFYQMIEQEAAKVEEAIGRTDITWSKEMQEFINKTPAFGEAIKKQLSSAASGLTTFLSKGADATKNVADIKKQIADLDGNEITGIGEQWDALNKKLLEQEGILDAIGIKSQSTAEAFGASIAGVFGALQQQGVSVVDALKIVEPAVSALQTQLEATGFSGGAAFDSIRSAIDLVKDPIAGPVLEAVNGLDEALIGLNNSGLLNQSTFEALTGQITQAFDSLVAQGKDGEQVLRLMQKPLQTAWELQKDFGFETDESTKALLDQAENAGIVGDKFRDPMERMIKAMDHMVEILEKIAIKFGAIPSEADAAAKGVDSAFQGKQIEIPVKWKVSGAPEAPGGGEWQGPSFAEGTGGKFLDFGKGMLAMLHGKERVMTEGEASGTSSVNGMLQPIIVNVDGLKLLEHMARLADRHGATMPLLYR